MQTTNVPTYPSFLPSVPSVCWVCWVLLPLLGERKPSATCLSTGQACLDPCLPADWADRSECVGCCPFVFVTCLGRFVLVTNMLCCFQTPRQTTGQHEDPGSWKAVQEQGGSEEHRGGAGRKDDDNS